MSVMPSRRRIEAALHQVTERFAAELAQPSAQTPDWSEFGWTMARAGAVLHGVTPLLASTTRWQAPAPWRQFAEEQRQATALRHERLMALLSRIDEQSCNAQLPIMALKGAALHRLGLYRAGERPMADLDLLVAPRDVRRAQDLLEAIGYHEVAVVWKHRMYEPHAPSHAPRGEARFGEHASATIKIDLHTRIAERLAASATDLTEHVWPREPSAGLNPYPSLVALLLHVVLHAAGNMTGLGLRLIHLHDIALLAARMQPADWSALLASRVGGRPPWWALPPLELVSRYYPERIPATVLSTLRPLCSRRLRALARRRKLSEVSYSTLRIRALPALSWARTLSDKLGYIRSRIGPDAEIGAELAVTRRESWASGSTWFGQSQGRRILQWLVARPRPATMYALHAAWADQAAPATPRPPDADGRDDAAQTR
jgi:Uncharacterised nucleotidyltransferase